jgi:hypothetical protein
MLRRITVDATRASSMTSTHSPVLESRFAKLARWQAALIVAVTVLVMVGGYAFQMHNRFLPDVMSAVSAEPAAKATGDATSAAVDDADAGDLALYRTITLRMADGAPYYATVVERHRKSNYPLRPFVTVRMPTLAYIGSTLGLPASRALLIGLLVMAGVVWWMRLKRITDVKTLQPLICILAISTGMFSFAITPDLAVSHEVWAGTLMALSWGMYGGFSDKPNDNSMWKWLPSVLLAAAAVLIRETALPFALLMGAFAVWHRQWRETAAWAAVAGLFAVCLAVHANYVLAATIPADLPSPGWTNLAGWPFFVLAMHGSTGLRILPEWLATIFVPLTMLGWASWRTPGRTETGTFGFLLFSGYALIFMVLGRPDNWYWGLLISPVFLMGLMFAPQAIADLVAAMRSTAASTGVSAVVSAVRAPATGKRRPTIATRPVAAR